MVGKERQQLKTSKAQQKANKKYDAENTRQINLKLNLKTDAEILARLDQVENKQGYIKELILKDLKKTEN